MSDGPFPSIDPELLVATFGTSGTIRYRNPAWERLFGRSADAWSSLSQDDADVARTMLKESSRGALVTGQLFLVPAAPGLEARPALLNFLPVHSPDPADIDAVMVTGELLEQPDSWTESQTERHRMETLGRMTMGIAHDFNNLLSGILGHSELMTGALARPLDPEVLSEHVETIGKAANDGGELIRKIQRYIRDEKESSFQPVDLPGLIQDCVVLTRPYWYNEPRRQGIAIAVEQQLEHVPAVAGSATELRDVLVNLILNAVQAMPGGGLISFRTFARNGRVHVSVKDTGVGMSDVVQSRIFEPLFTTKGDRGTGMGLSVAYGVIQEHGGNLGVESRLGEGARFTIDLPTAEFGASAQAEPKAAVPDRSLKILVVDDESMVRTVLRRLLGLRGHQVTDVGSGKEGLETLEGGTYDIIITDQGMPEMDGREFAGHVAERHPGLPVLLLTGDTHAGTAEGAIVAVMAKPFRIDEVVEALNTHA